MAYSYFTDGVVDPIAVTAGIVQTGLYLDFFYVYFTKYVSPVLSRNVNRTSVYLGYYRDKSSNCRHNLLAFMRGCGGSKSCEGASWTEDWITCPSREPLHDVYFPAWSGKLITTL